MHLANPAGLWPLLLVPPIVVLHLLRMRRNDHKVSSTLLWQQVISDLQANTPFQRLRANLQLILQLLLVLLLALGLGDCQLRGPNEQGRSIVAILDASASMQARDGDPRRFDVAREALLAEIERLGPADEMMVLVAAAGGVRRQLDFTRSAHELRSFVAPQQATDGSGGVREALLLAVGALRPRLRHGARTAEILIASDGALGSLAELEQQPYPVRLLPCGRRARNLGITALDVRRMPHSQTRYAVFVEVSNYSRGTRRPFVSLGEGETGGGISSRRLALRPGQAVGHTFQLDIRPGPINISLDARDDLPLDDRVVAFIARPQPLRVLVLTPGNPFLLRALAVDPLARVDVRRAAPPELAGYDLVVCDRTPAPPSPDCPMLLIAPPTPPPGLRVRETHEGVRISHWSRSHPSMRYLQLGDVSILRATSYRVAAGRGLAFVGDKPVLVALTQRRFEDLVVGFTLQHSNWPLRASFPMFVFNVLEHIRQTKHLAATRTIRPGETLPIEAPGARELRIQTPSGRTLDLSAALSAGTAYVRETDEVGVYRIQTDRGSSSFAVNLLSHEESNVTPRTRLDLGRGEQSDARTEEVDRPIWRWFAGIGLLTVLLEWWVFHRKIA